MTVPVLGPLCFYDFTLPKTRVISFPNISFKTANQKKDFFRKQIYNMSRVRRLVFDRKIRRQYLNQAVLSTELPQVPPATWELNVFHGLEGKNTWASNLDFPWILFWIDTTKVLWVDTFAPRNGILLNNLSSANHHFNILSCFQELCQIALKVS